MPKPMLGLGSKGTLVGAAIEDKYFFLYAFAKNDRANISAKEKLALKELAREFLEFGQDELKQLIEDGELIKVGEL